MATTRVVVAVLASNVAMSVVLPAPAFRATFQLTATVPANWATVSNMPVTKRVVNGALATTQFARSPRMPSYLVGRYSTVHEDAGVR